MCPTSTTDKHPLQLEKKREGGKTVSRGERPETDDGGGRKKRGTCTRSPSAAHLVARWKERPESAGGREEETRRQAVGKDGEKPLPLPTTTMTKGKGESEEEHIISTDCRLPIPPVILCSCRRRGQGRLAKRQPFGHRTRALSLSRARIAPTSHCSLMLLDAPGNRVSPLSPWCHCPRHRLPSQPEDLSIDFSTQQNPSAGECVRESSFLPSLSDADAHGATGRDRGSAAAAASAVRPHTGKGERAAERETEPRTRAAACFSCASERCCCCTFPSARARSRRAGASERARRERPVSHFEAVREDAACISLLL